MFPQFFLFCSLLKFIGITSVCAVKCCKVALCRLGCLQSIFFLLQQKVCQSEQDFVSGRKCMKIFDREKVAK